MENEINPQPVVPRGLRYFSEFMIMIAMVFIGGGIFYTMGITLLGPLFGLNSETLAAALSNGNVTREQLYGLKLIQGLYTVGSFLVPALFIPRILKVKRNDYLQINNYARWYHYVIGILLIVCSSPFISLVYDLNRLVSLPADLAATLRKMEDEAAMMTQVILDVNNGWDMFWNVILIALLPAVAEELLFRGAMQKFFYNWTSSIHAAIIISAVIFSAIHGQFYGLIPRIVLGVLLGYMVVYSGTIWVSVVAHAFNNLSAVIMTNLQQRGLLPEVLGENYHFPDYIAWISLVLTLGLVLLLRRIQPRVSEAETI